MREMWDTIVLWFLFAFVAVAAVILVGGVIFAVMYGDWDDFSAWLEAPAPAGLVILLSFIVVFSIGGTRPIINRLDDISFQLSQIINRIDPPTPDPDEPHF
jgi:hypothetical protein